MISTIWYIIVYGYRWNATRKADSSVGEFTKCLFKIQLYEILIWHNSSRYKINGTIEGAFVCLTTCYSLISMISSFEEFQVRKKLRYFALDSQLPKRCGPTFDSGRFFFVQLWGASFIHPQPPKKNRGWQRHKILPPSRLRKNKQRRTNNIIWVFPKVGGFPQIIHFNRGYHYKPSSLGYPNFWKHPY